MGLDVRREFEVVKLGFACADVGLDENTAGATVGNDTLKTDFEGGACTQNNHGTDLSSGA